MSAVITQPAALAANLKATQETTADAIKTLRITEIFHSIQGESSRVGLPSVFIRLTGCPLRCTWCDTAYAFQGGNSVSVESILEQVAEFNCKNHLRYRWRATGAKKLPVATYRTLRCQLFRLTGNQRRAGYQRRRSARLAHC